MEMGDTHSINYSHILMSVVSSPTYDKWVLNPTADTGAKKQSHINYYFF